jgi:hypothetical protein
MLFRSFQIKSTGKMLGTVLTIDGPHFRVSAEAHAQNMADAFNIPIKDIIVIESKEPPDLTGALYLPDKLPPFPPSSDRDVALKESLALLRGIDPRTISDPTLSKVVESLQRLDGINNGQYDTRSASDSSVQPTSRTSRVLR